RQNCCACPTVGTGIGLRRWTLAKMVTGTGALSIEETFLGPQALPPPPTRHALFAILIALAALVHFGTIGIGDLYSETEGQYAAAAREMIQSGQYLLPTNDSIPRLQKPPLLYWLIVASYKLFGVNTAATLAALAIFYREARMRFRSLLWWPYLLLFLAIIGPWYLWIEIHFDGPFHRLVADEWTKHLLGRYPNENWYDDVPRWQFLASHLAWLFPWSLAILPGLTFFCRRVMRPRQISFQDALPMAWAIVVLGPVLAIGQRQDYYALSMFSAFALWAAMIFERAPNSMRNLGAT